MIASYPYPPVMLAMLLAVTALETNRATAKLNWNVVEFK
jgi:hypothetical protein